MSEPMITSAGAEDAANDLVGDASNEDALLYYVIMSGILASFGAACQIWFSKNYWIAKTEEYHSILVNNFFPLTIGYVLYLAFPDTPLVTSALLFLIASSVEGPWWELWGVIGRRIQVVDQMMYKNIVPASWDYEYLGFYLSIGVQAVFTLTMMFGQAFLLPKVYSWADSQEKFAPIYM